MQRCCLQCLAMAPALSWQAGRQAGRCHLQLVVGVGLVPAGRAVVGDRVAKLDGGAGSIVAVVVHPEAAVVAACHVAVGWEPHLHAPRGLLLSAQVGSFTKSAQTRVIWHMQYVFQCVAQACQGTGIMQSMEP